MGREWVKTRFVWFKHVTVSIAVSSCDLSHRSDYARVGGVTTLYIAVSDYEESEYGHHRNKQNLMESVLSLCVTNNRTKHFARTTGVQRLFRVRFLYILGSATTHHTFASTYIYFLKTGYITMYIHVFFLKKYVYTCY